MLTGLSIIHSLEVADWVLDAGKGLQSGLCTAKDQCMHIVRAFVGIDRFKINHVSHDMIFFGNPVTTMHIS